MLENIFQILGIFLEDFRIILEKFRKEQKLNEKYSRNNDAYFFPCILVIQTRQNSAHVLKIVTLVHTKRFE